MPAGFAGRAGPETLWRTGSESLCSALSHTALSFVRELELASCQFPFLSTSAPLSCRSVIRRDALHALHGKSPAVSSRHAVSFVLYSMPSPCCTRMCPGAAQTEYGVHSITVVGTVHSLTVVGTVHVLSAQFLASPNSDSVTMRQWI